MVGGLPTGVVTLLFTDVEGSTRLLQELGDAGSARADGAPGQLVACPGLAQRASEARKRCCEPNARRRVPIRETPIFVECSCTAAAAVL